MDDIYNKYYLLIEEVEADMETPVGEAVRRKVIRKGKMRKKLFCPKGMKAKGSRCVPMRGVEKARRRRALKKTAIKRKGKMGRIIRKIKRSRRRRKAMGLH